MDEENKSANKGELSEFYAFLKILSDRKLIPADADLKPQAELALPVLKIFRSEERNEEKIYDITSDSDNILVYVAEGKEPIVISSQNITSKLSGIFSKIATDVKDDGEIRGMMDYLHCHKFRGMPAGSKEDIAMTVHSPSTGQNPRMAYSIKSQVGSPATLLNASGATNFIFELIPVSGDLSVENLNKNIGATRRLNEALSTGCELKFSNTSSDVFKQNMDLIDYAFPELMALLLSKFYTIGKSKLNEVFDDLEDTINLPISGVAMRKDAAIYKIKHFLAAVALGMTPSTAWDGVLSATGGYLIVKSDGSLVCFHIFNMDNFKDYLFKSTKFEKGSETRHEYGTIYEKDGKYFIKLNLQIRFIK